VSTDFKHYCEVFANTDGFFEQPDKVPDEGISEEKFTPTDEDPTMPYYAVEEDCVSEEDKDAVATIPKEIKAAVRRVHCNLGHPERRTMLRMFKLGHASQAATEYAKVFKCPICEARQKPKRPPRAGHMKPTGFNQEVFIDLKECRDHNRTRYHVLSMVDAASSYHLATVAQVPKEVDQSLWDSWSSHPRPRRRV
jgi:hypothetical protein